jgi:hypothetical protein
LLAARRLRAKSNDKPVGVTVHVCAHAALPLPLPRAAPWTYALLVAV